MDFELDKMPLIEYCGTEWSMCWFCKNRANCPLDYECPTVKGLEGRD